MIRGAGTRGEPDQPGGWRTVILLHELPDGTAHFDWMIDSRRSNSNRANSGIAGGDERRLITFRISSRVDEQGPSSAPVSLERLDNHREAYLHLEGDIGGGRGVVNRVAEGMVRDWLEASGGPEHWFMQIEWQCGRSIREQYVELREEKHKVWWLFPAAERACVDNNAGVQRRVERSGV